MGYGAYLQQLYPDSHNVYGPVYSAFLGALGWMFDQIDPYATGLPNEFSVTRATGTALDKNGADWGILREAGEGDVSYRARILGALKVYATGDTLAGIAGIVQAFTGVLPVIHDGIESGWRFGSSISPTDTWGSADSRFRLWIYVQNPTGAGYSHLAMETAVRRVLPARSAAWLYHNGPDTSSLHEAANAVVNLLGM